MLKEANLTIFNIYDVINNTTNTTNTTNTSNDIKTDNDKTKSIIIFFILATLVISLICICSKRTNNGNPTYTRRLNVQVI
jgi:hypothetical protein